MVMDVEGIANVTDSGSIIRESEIEIWGRD
jgi:hypothetical protein